MEEFPSGQRGQTVNLLRFASVVQIHPPPPTSIQTDGRFLFTRRKKAGVSGLDSPRKMGPASLLQIRQEHIIIHAIYLFHRQRHCAGFDYLLHDSAADRKVEKYQSADGYRIFDFCRAVRVYHLGLSGGTPSQRHSVSDGAVSFCTTWLHEQK